MTDLYNLTMNYRLLVFAIFFTAELLSNAKGSTCQQKVEKVGCFHDYTRPLDKLIIYRRSSLDIEPQKTALPRLLCDCATKAKLQGYTYIGLQYYAECWTSSETEPDYDRDGQSTNQCFNPEYQTCSLNDTVCVGGANANFVYKIVDSDDATPEINRTPTETSPTRQEILHGTKPAPTFQTSGKQPSKRPSMPSTAASPSSQLSTEKPPEKPIEASKESWLPTLQYSEITEPTTVPSGLTSQITRKPSPNNKIPSSQMTGKIPSTMLSTVNTKPPCEDKQPDCPQFESFCSIEYPYTLEQCPKTCQQCE